MFTLNDTKTLKDKVNSVDLTASKDLQTYIPKYEYTIKVFEEGEDGRPLTSIQKGIKANSDNDLRELYALSDQKIQILEKREINSSTNNDQQLQMSQSFATSNIPLEQKVRMAMQEQGMIQQSVPQQVIPQQVKPAEPQVKYFSGGGIDFKLVGDDLYQRQWVRATEDECKRIRIINDANNKIVELKDKHFELLNWVKVESTDKVAN